MSSQHPRKNLFVIWMTLGVFLASVPATLAQTETRRPPQGTSTPKARILKSKGSPRIPQDPGPNPPPPPLALSVVEKNQILKSLKLPPLTGPGSVYVRLNPRDNYVADNFLSFHNAYVVQGVKSDPGYSSGHAYWGPALDEKNKFLEVTLKPEAAGSRYLIDCAVNQSLGANYPFKIWDHNDLFQTVESVGPQGQHLVFLLEAPDKYWHSFRISGGSGWLFYSCEVTRL